MRLTADIIMVSVGIEARGWCICSRNDGGGRVRPNVMQTQQVNFSSCVVHRCCHRCCWWIHTATGCRGVLLAP